MKIVGIGRSSVDFLGIIDEYPLPDTKTLMEEFSIQGGGPCATALVTLKRLGCQCYFISKISDDFFGKFMLEELQKEGVNTDGVIIDSGKLSQYACILVEPVRGRRTIFWTQGTVSSIEASEIKWELFKNCDAFHYDGHFIPATIKILERISNSNIVTSYDAGTWREGSDFLVRYTNLLAATPQFALSYTNKDDVFEAVVKMRKHKVVYSAITLGSEGSIGFDGRRIYTVTAFPVNVIDTTGAGDVFHGAFLFAFLKGWDLKESLIFANAVSAIKCTKLGGRPGIPTLNQAIEFIKKNRNKIKIKEYKL